MKETHKGGNSACPVSQRVKTASREQSTCEEDHTELFCSLCRTDFYSLSSLKDHFSDMHVVQWNTRSFSCVSCKPNFKSLATAINHLLRSHTKEKIDSCEKCGTKFGQPRTVSAICRKQAISERHCAKCKGVALVRQIANQKRKFGEPETDEIRLKADEPEKCTKRRLSGLVLAEEEEEEVQSEEDRLKLTVETENSTKRQLSEVVIKKEIEEIQQEEDSLNLASDARECTNRQLPDVVIKEEEEEEAQPGEDLLNLTGETKRYTERWLTGVVIKDEIEEVQPEEDEEETISCDYCQFSFPSVRVVERHIRLSHPGSKT